MSMNNYKTHGWQNRHWRDVEDYSKDLFRCAADLDRGIVSGSDTFEPGDVRALARRLEIISRRLRELSDDY